MIVKMMTTIEMIEIVDITIQHGFVDLIDHTEDLDTMILAM